MRHRRVEPIERKVKFSIYCRPGLVVRLEKRCQERQISRSWLVQELLEQGIFSESERDPEKLFTEIFQRFELLRGLINKKSEG